MKATTVAPLMLAAAIGLAGCSDKTTTTTSETTAASPAATTTEAAESPTATETVTETATETETETETAAETTSGGTDVGSFDPNSASEEEIASRLQQAGVPDADAWAKRIKENGPYTAENAQQKVQELAQKYPIDINTLNQVRQALGF